MCKEQLSENLVHWAGLGFVLEGAAADARVVGLGFNVFFLSILQCSHFCDVGKVANHL
jgi:hypothetical protein